MHWREAVKLRFVAVEWLRGRVTLTWKTPTKWPVREPVSEPRSEEARSLFGWHDGADVMMAREFEILPADHVDVEKQRVVEDIILESGGKLTLEDTLRAFLRTPAGQSIAAQHLQIMALKGKLHELFPMAEISSIEWRSTGGMRFVIGQDGVLQALPRHDGPSVAQTVDAREK